MEPTCCPNKQKPNKQNTRSPTKNHLKHIKSNYSTESARFAYLHAKKSFFVLQNYGSRFVSVEDTKKESSKKHSVV